MQISVAGTDTGSESTASRAEIFIAWRPINHHPQTGKPPSHSATPELLQLLTSSIAFKINESKTCIAHKSLRICERCRLGVFQRQTKYPDIFLNNLGRQALIVRRQITWLNRIVVFRVPQIEAERKPT